MAIMIFEILSRVIITKEYVNLVYEDPNAPVWVEAYYKTEQSQIREILDEVNLALDRDELIVIDTDDSSITLARNISILCPKCISPLKMTLSGEECPTCGYQRQLLEDT